MSKILPIKSTLDEKYINETETITEPALEALISGGGSGGAMMVRLGAMPSSSQEWAPEVVYLLDEEFNPLEGDALTTEEEKINATIDNGGVILADLYLIGSGNLGLYPCAIVNVKRFGPLGATGLLGGSGGDSYRALRAIVLMKDEFSSDSYLAQIVYTFEFPLIGANGEGTLNTYYLNRSVDVEVNLESDSNVANIYIQIMSQMGLSASSYSKYDFLHSCLYAGGGQTTVPVSAYLSTTTVSGNKPSILLHTKIYSSSIILSDNNDHIYFYFDAPIEQVSDGTTTRYSQKRIFVDLDNADSATYKIYETTLNIIEHE